ncbi:MAG: DUF1549 domain-containing protein [Planctomycetes bacterium]|nr:DUF1549 domain-containing protein [Planctomycetota bacterium]
MRLALLFDLALLLVCVLCCASLAPAEELAVAGASAAAATESAARVNFELDVLPVLTAAGCNSGACHGKARGQNGFQLSLLGFDPDFDYAAITQEARGRRVFPAAPDRSLLLQKPTAQVPHGGGERLTLESPEYRTVIRWIASGLPRASDDSPALERISIAPGQRSLARREQQQLTVTAHYSDRSTRDVTRLCDFQSSEEAVVAVKGRGLLKAGTLVGESTIMARYMGQIATWNTAILQDGGVPAELYADLPRKNFIDEHVWNKLKALGITPSEPAGDSTFLRRAYLDVIGRLPTPDEARAFLADPSSDKRERLVDDLLARPEYADFWANKWADLLRPNPYRVNRPPESRITNFIATGIRSGSPL